MQLVITTPAVQPTATADITWVAKGGSSVADQGGRFAIRKNSKGVWRLFDGGILVHEGTKDSAKEYAAKLATASTLNLKASLFTGEAKVYSKRADGTMRRRHFLTGEDLKGAQELAIRREAGASMGTLAQELHASVSHVRRMLIDLAITEELMEQGEDELHAILIGADEATGE